MIPRRCRASLLVLALVAWTAPGCGLFPHSSPRLGRDSGRITSGEAADIQIALGRSLESEGNPEGALAAYGEAIRRDPKRADAHVRLAVAMDRLGRFAEATPHFEAALKLRPGDAEIFCDRGYSLALQGKPTEAEASLRQAIAKDPKLARAHNNLGLVLGRSGRAEEALSEFRKAGCPEPDAHLNLAFALGQERKWSEARKQVKIARGLGANVKDFVAEADDLGSLLAKAESAPPQKTIDPAVRTVSGTAPRKPPAEALRSARPLSPPPRL